MIEMGGWKSAYECYKEPSQDFLFRAWKKNKRILLKPFLSVLAIQSGSRKNSYKNRDSKEHIFYALKMEEDIDFRFKALGNIYIQNSRHQHYIQGSMYHYLHRKTSDVFNTLCLLVKINPRDLKTSLFRRKGDYIRKLRKFRGLN